MNVQVSIEEIDVWELLMKGTTELRYSIDGKPQEPLELSYQPVAPKKMTVLDEQRGHVRLEEYEWPLLFTPEEYEAAQQHAMLGYYPNPLTMPPAMPAKTPEPEFGVVVVAHAQVPLSTVNALLSGKFIQEGEMIDTSFKQYIVLFDNNDYNRNEAMQVRQQLRDIIPGVDVVVMPINGS